MSSARGWGSGAPETGGQACGLEGLGILWGLNLPVLTLLFLLKNLNTKPQSESPGLSCSLLLRSWWQMQVRCWAWGVILGVTGYSEPPPAAHRSFWQTPVHRLLSFLLSLGTGTEGEGNPLRHTVLFRKHRAALRRRGKVTFPQTGLILR